LLTLQALKLFNQFLKFELVSWILGVTSYEIPLKKGSTEKRLHVWKCCGFLVEMSSVKLSGPMTWRNLESQPNKLFVYWHKVVQGVIIGVVKVAQQII